MSHHIFFGILLAFFSACLQAQQSSALEGKMKVSKVVREKIEGSSKWKYKRVQDTSNTKPGDVLEYKIDYKNVSKQPVLNVEITGPIPSETRIRQSSIEVPDGSTWKVSIDGGATYHFLPIYEEIMKDGKPTKVKVPSSRWTHIRCRVPSLDQGKKAVVRYWVVVR